MMDIKEMWEADRLRTERVRGLDGAELDAALAAALGDKVGYWNAAATVQAMSMAALGSFEQKHPDRMEAFAQRLLDEVAPWSTIFGSAIELDGGEAEARMEGMLGGATVLRILTAKPASIVRAIILSLPERG